MHGIFIRRFAVPGLFVLLILLVAACGDQICTETVRREPPLFVTFYQYTNAARTQERVDTLNFTGIFGLGNEASLVSSTQRITGLRLPFTPAQDSTVFIFQRADVAEPDTLVIGYTRQPLFISQACGFEMRYSDLVILRHTLTNAEIQQTSAQIANEFRIKLYF
jgi:hypothetical protein